MPAFKTDFIYKSEHIKPLNPILCAQFYIRTYNIDSNATIEIKSEAQYLEQYDKITLTKGQLKSISILAHKKSMDEKGLNNLFKLKNHEDFIYFYENNYIRCCLNFEDKQKREINLMPLFHYHSLLSINKAILSQNKSGDLQFGSSFYVSTNYSWKYLSFTKFQKSLNKVKLIYSPYSNKKYYIRVSQNIYNTLKILTNASKLKEFIK
ncbi:hypothetical protein [Borreliella garinii]|uniref:hypothetical protein n=1 Tax=Borreliella garinii TaxID=29519 RepID=UPI00018ACEE1|nr:hypothetical protein [Borreliella garinii]ACL35113.1 conserved hypothetical protein [Borreliella garinii Far04]WNZ67231.1 hypothetical protein PT139_05370 [Borreliella garinii]WNZ68229.1 hypothetical protein PT135_05380 [Borreliella garinii]WNZ69229.1 hypothetical protein PT138_05395 [Borreliella garinii]WNZ70229.1 hypothetical protein PT140_05375 [Borreliella garinii]